ncbi:MAG: hypothetical protein ACRD59_06735 [Candidatus Acidiferrales bacterium]
MSEATCESCGAVFASTPGSLCPHCRRNPKSALSKILSQIPDYVWPILAFLAWVVLADSADGGWVGLAIIALVIAWPFLSQKSQRGLHEPVTALNLDPTGARARAVAVGLTEIASSPPKTPEEWESLLVLPRPRELYLRASAKVDLVFESILFVAGIWFAIFMIERDYIDWKRLGSGVFLAVWLSIWILGELERIRNELQARRLLRDGEVTIGLIVDWYSGRHSTRLKYQYWTRMGQGFEHTGKIMSERKFYLEKGPVPVFYLPEEPTKSVALCCAVSRVRYSGERSFNRHSSSVRN